MADENNGLKSVKAIKSHLSVQFLIWIGIPYNDRIIE